MSPVVAAVLAWFAAAGATWIITNTSILKWWRSPHEARLKARAETVLRDYRAIEPDNPLRWRYVRRYEWLVALAEAPGCRMCVGFWMYALAGLAAWWQLGLPAQLWGGEAVFTLPAAVIGGWWAFVVIAEKLDPPPASPPATVLRG